jgi:hypothetical protein
VLHVQVGVQLGEDEDLRSPVLGVRRAVLQPEEGEAGGGEGQAAQTVSPLLLRTAGTPSGQTAAVLAIRRTHLSRVGI